ncbi:hypothetical protein PAXINDRAFT_12359 [Paxillus involutus ATCC 200175]|uniref:Uncharacterized protein n=1 Tax=Paxillus involutus ATCC 200175 TaxID=664439 RepID=A0A0C9U5S9_PAXIN|nr:hypothetical protein PAXINDRAFT_12359 [Paxillus involutus ATCC 200175]
MALGGLMIDDNPQTLHHPSTLMALSTNPGIEEQRQQITSALKDVLTLIKKLPLSLSGTPDGPIAVNFTNFDIDDDEGPYFTVNRAWERTFQKKGEAAIT